jgi:hypothetical protein
VYSKPTGDSSNDIGFRPSLEVVSWRMHMGPTCQDAVMIAFPTVQLTGSLGLPRSVCNCTIRTGSTWNLPTESAAKQSVGRTIIEEYRMKEGWVIHIRHPPKVDRLSILSLMARTYIPWGPRITREIKYKLINRT